MSPSFKGVTVSAFAHHLGVSHQTVYALLADRSGISVEMALRLGMLLGTDPKRWLDMQNKFDLWQVQAKLHVELGRIKRTVYVKKA